MKEEPAPQGGKRGVTRVTESVDHKHEQCCCVSGTAWPTWTL